MLRGSCCGGSGECQGTDDLSVAFQLAAQGLARLQGALRQQQLESQEALRQEGRAVAALRDGLGQVGQRDADARDLEQRLEMRIQKLEGSLAAMERVLPQAGGQIGGGGGTKGPVEDMDERLKNLEASVKRVLDVFPRVEAVVARLEKSSLSIPSPLPPFDSPATFISTYPWPRTSNPLEERVSGGAAKNSLKEQYTAVDEEYEKNMVDLRVREVKVRRDKANPNPFSLEDNLCSAAFHKRLEDVQCLIRSGVDVNCTTLHGDTPLINAVKCPVPNDDVVVFLVESGADVNAVDVNGKTALHHAISNECACQSVPLLVGSGADANARDVFGATPLHRAALEGSEMAVRALLAAGSKTSLRGWRGWWSRKTPSDTAPSDRLRELLRT